jgi:hypothetical protein
MSNASLLPSFVWRKRIAAVHTTIATVDEATKEQDTMENLRYGLKGQKQEFRQVEART